MDSEGQRHFREVVGQAYFSREIGEDEMNWSRYLERRGSGFGVYGTDDVWVRAIVTPVVMVAQPREMRLYLTALL